MTDNLLRNDKLAKDILGRLREYGELPKKGFLAGGAVANTILSMKWGGDFPMNDLDIFQIESTKGLKSKKMPERYTGVKLDYNHYEGIILVSNSERLYTVSRAQKYGMLNLIDIQLNGNHQSLENYRIILEGFDLNCCPVGIDLESEELIYLPSFESFLETMQLRVGYPYTPFHTAIRLFKKKEELDAYCDCETEIKYLSQVPLVLSASYAHWPGFHKDNTKYAKRFGKDYHNMYLQHKDDLDKYFEIVSCQKPTPGGKGTIELFSFISRNSSIIEELKDCRSVAAIKAIWDLLQGRKSIRDKNLRALKLDRYSSDSVIANPQYAQCDWDEKHAKQIENFVSQHPYMEVVFYHFKLNIQEQLMALRVIRKMVNKEGLFVIGLIENTVWKSLSNNDQSLLPPNNLITEEWIQSLVDAYLIKNSGQLKEPEDLADFEFSHYTTELVTAKDLMSEGIRMHHCVGGYVGAIKDGRSIIFHIEADGEGSTLEISKHAWEGTVSRIDLAQHRGVWNKEPSSFHLMIGKSLIEYLKEKMDFKEDIRETALNRLLARLREGRLRRQEENVEEVNNP